MLSWPHSGFHVHATAPFPPSDEELVRNRLAYAFRPPVALKRISFDGKNVTLTTTKRRQLSLTPCDFLAKLTLHIPDRYQNIRRYAGFYSPNIQHRMRLARAKDAPAGQRIIEESKPAAPKWAAMIAQIFGKIPVTCPECSTIMDLRGFVFDKAVILKFLPYISRAPPKRELADFVPDKSDTRYVRTDNATATDTDFNQVRPELNEDFNQDLNW